MLLFFLGCYAAVNAQGRVQGKVFEDKTYIGVPGVKVENLNNHAAIATDAVGAFSIAAKKGDLLKFTSIGHKPDTVYLTSLDPISVYLTPQQNMLEEVKVQQIEFPPGAFAYKPLMGPMGSKTVRYQTDKQGNPIGGVKVSISDLFGNDKAASERKIEQLKLDAQISEVFNQAKLAQYLPISGQELTNFVILYKPSIETFYAANFKMTEYLNDCYRKFMQIPEEKRKSKELVSLK